ncbi:hypothetical protein BN2476_1150053 [Paraburkholderia piptadeniae]|uniref:Uncharacterized protein n=1 Tax=Paraburkholderia piptadeniae TaxID=1701573 RepID=A0A1N7SVF2_9BURK|nr:hypothetical protein BN2476_1150053 [Paraburkholderia piptadeniae]
MLSANPAASKARGVFYRLYYPVVYRTNPGASGGNNWDNSRASADTCPQEARHAPYRCRCPECQARREADPPV